MKKRLSVVKQLATVAVTTGIVCFAASAYGQAAAPEPTIEPARVGSMSAIGQKPRKADAEKQDATTTTTSSTAAASPSKAAAPGDKLAAQDEQFVTLAAKGNQEEIHMGKMAAQQGQSAEVKKMGTTIAADHQKAQDQLMQIAQQKGVKPRLPRDQMKMSKKDMANFDQVWIAMMINDHQKEIAVFERQAQQGADADLKAYARKTVPVLKKHLKMVQQAQKKMGSGATNPAGMGANAGATKTGR